VTHSILVRPQLLGRPLVVLRKVRRWTKHTQHPDSGRMAMTSAQTLRGAGPAITVGGIPRAGVLMRSPSPACGSWAAHGLRSVR